MTGVDRHRQRVHAAAGESGRDPPSEPLTSSRPGRDISIGTANPFASSPLDAEILRLLVPATLAVFLDPAMALIDTGASL